MSDNLAHKINNARTNQEKNSASANLNNPVKKTGSAFNENEGSSQELELQRRRFKASQKQDPAYNNDYPGNNESTNDDEDIGQLSDQPETSEFERAMEERDERKKTNTVDTDNLKSGDLSKLKGITGDKLSKDIGIGAGAGMDKPLTKDQKQEKFDQANPQTQQFLKDKGLVPKDNPNNQENKPEGLGPKIEKENLKIPDKKDNSKANEKNEQPNQNKANESPGLSTAQKLNQAKNVASKALSGDAIGAGEEAVGATTQVGTQWLLSTLWGTVWLDWTLLSLLGLNVLLVFSILLPNYVCQFGDDYLIGKWIPSKDLAKWTEIILLMVINVLIFSIILILVIIIYKIVTCSTWDLINVGVAGILPGGDTSLSEAQTRCFQ